MQHCTDAEESAAGEFAILIPTKLPERLFVRFLVSCHGRAPCKPAPSGSHGGCAPLIVVTQNFCDDKESNPERSVCESVCKWTFMALDPLEMVP